jgi:isoquinoline 1-oxidoreductase beta subunit
MQKIKISRKEFIKSTSFAGSGLMLGFLLPGMKAFAQTNAAACDFFQPNAFLKIDTKGLITIFVARQEMGQGVNTSLPMLVAEELDADWKKIKVEIAPFGSLPDGSHDTGGSQSVLTDFTSLRKAGAVAKAMLIAAAAKLWNIKPEQCAADNGTVVHTGNMKSISYGELVCEAAKTEVPKEVVLKSPKDFKLIGKEQKKNNLKDILTGKTKYGIDLKVPGMLYASVERCPVLGGKLISVDDSEALKVNGVVKVVTYKGTGVPMHVRDGVAVVAKNIWAAMKARKLLKIKWDEGTKNKQNSTALFQQMTTSSLQLPAFVKLKKGDITKIKLLPTNSVTAIYKAPFLAHACMEPINFIASVKDGMCEMWGGLQLPDWTVNEIVKSCGLKKENIKVNLALMGGGFGRRLHFEFAIEAVKIAQQLNAPVKMINDRVDDIRFDNFRPANVHRLQASWDGTGKLQSWYHHVLSTSIAVMTNGPDTKDPAENLGGADTDFYYDVPNVTTGYSHVDFNINRGWLRSVEICMNSFPIECFIDEVARKLKKDPLAYRLSLLEGRPMFMTGEGPGAMKQYPQRIANVLKLAAEKIGYNQPRKKNHFIGVATHSFIFAKAYAAHAIEIEMTGPKKFRIVKVVGAIDCGIVVNPDGLRNQMEGGVAFALQQALKGEITVQNSRVVQDGFNGFELLRYNEMPPVEIYTIASEEEPGGVGEVGLPTVAPALCNALAAAGARPRTLPIRNEGFEWE